ncbi:ribonuclease R [Anaerostipes sp. 992a]|uniref:ribonuclease R n=1 Tax=Anaerostipes sp. 992a TaxID=1261637 RepID=UPI0009534E41|nr:ribonuclease R [Anaerostipes sp. 992a]MDD5969206.1 ribonuclease R [Anaerostipes sp.]OLR63772.1 ribonuclease R [Anaerostipes sp. 992a]
MKKNELYEQRKKIVYNIIQDDVYQPLKLKEFSYLLQVPPRDREQLKQILDELVAEGKISITKKGKYTKLEKGLVRGIFESNARGFGFVTVEGEEEDYFIPENAVGDAMYHDVVLMQVVVPYAEPGKRKEGKVIKVLERGITQVVGTFQKSRNFGFVVPDNQRFEKDIFLSKSESKNLSEGHKVVVKIIDYGGDGKNPEGKVLEVLGHANDPRVDVLSVIKAYDVPLEFPQEVMQQVKRVNDEVLEREKAGRMDIRGWQTVTIDGEDAKDLDDAITLTRQDGGYQLGVHIADVSHYVTEGSALDQEALKRGTSIYLIDRVIPMLPHKLSNGICSLNAGVDRLALSCIMDIDAKGRIIGHKIAETVVRVDERMSYTSVAKILEEQDPEEIKRYENLVPMFQLMKELSDILRQHRHERGSIDFDFPESKLILDEDGRPLEIYPYDRNCATKIIEDFMLAANETIAEDFFWQELPFVYRTHESPDPDKIQKLAVFIQNFGYFLKNSSKDHIHPKEIQKLLNKIEGTEEEALISRLALRSMKQARYTTTNIGHFGLSAKYYCHFTSPIRRYPDLQIHRIIKENLHGNLQKKRVKHYEQILPKVAEISSKTERRAEEMEREVVKMKKVEYMEQHLGEIFVGVISGITTWGIYVELPNTIEGMIRVADMIDDYYNYDERSYSMVGEMTGRTFELGMRVAVRVKETNRMLRTIDFELYDEDMEE